MKRPPKDCGIVIQVVMRDGDATFRKYRHVTALTHEEARIPYKILSWFPMGTGSQISDRLFGKKEKELPLRVGIILRRGPARILSGSDKLYDSLRKRLKCDVDKVYFEDASFPEQAKFCRDHEIIISPHGAQLGSIIFIRPGGLVIEIAAPEWIPYDYFPGLSLDTGKSHVLICNQHPYPKWFLTKNQRESISFNLESVHKAISKYLSLRPVVEPYLELMS